MKYWKCDFCIGDIGPNICKNYVCDLCIRGSKFSLKRRMHPKQHAEWKRHQDLDKFIDSLGIEVYSYQREILHMYLSDTKQKLQLMMLPPKHGFTFAQFNAMKIKEIVQDCERNNVDVKPSYTIDKNGKLRFNGVSIVSEY